MRIVCVGGGPAGLYLALLMKKRDPSHEVRVLERNKADDTYGWGVVFSEQTLERLERADPESYAAISAEFFPWDDIEIHFRGRSLRSSGHGFVGMARRRLLAILQERCRALGVELSFESEVTDDALLREADVIVASDGVNSALRGRHAETFLPSLEQGRCRYIWLGTGVPLDAFTFAFERTEHGWFAAHAYRFDGDTSTFIVETPEEVWQAHGFDSMPVSESVSFCEKLFAPYLKGHALRTNDRHPRGSQWVRFLKVHNERWWHRNVVLLGDAAHTAHFSIGSGTKLAMEDSISLADALLKSPGDLPKAFTKYEKERRVEVLKLQNAARNSTEWFENVARYAVLDPEQFAYSLLTRSQRISHENLRVRDRAYLESVERFIAVKAGLDDRARPPMFTPFTLRGLTLPNRVVVSPMAMYSAREGVAGEFHLVHMGARAHGGAGLVFTEMTCVSADARITPGCAGLWNDEQEKSWERVVQYVHRETPAKVALQLGHAGPKGSTQLGWQQPDEPLPEGNWPLVSASAVPYGPRSQTPRAMTRDEMNAVREQFVESARRGARCGFDWLELHCAHGYLLSAFLCPLTNKRDDEYGGSLENRARYPLEVFRAMRAVWPEERPFSVRISAHDWAPGGNTPDDAVAIARLFKEAGCDLLDVSSGQTTLAARPVYGRMYQTPFADRIRNEVGVATMAVGAIFEPDHVNGILAAGRADLCALARPHLADPAWTLHAAAQLGYADAEWPVQYLSGRDQLYRNAARAQGGQP